MNEWKNGWMHGEYRWMNGYMVNRWWMNMYDVYEWEYVYEPANNDNANDGVQ